MKEKERSKEVINMSTKVLIVGGGLSGLMLSKKLTEREIDHIVLESSPLHKCASIHYLVSSKTAELLGISEEYRVKANEREPIVGYRRLDGLSHETKSAEEIIPSNEQRDGFVTFSLLELRNIFTNTSMKYGHPAIKIRRGNNNWIVVAKNNLQIQSDIVIDATGAQAKTYRLIKNKNGDAINKRPVRACYGGVFPYDGPENELLFIDNFPAYDGIPRECAGWIMPIGNNEAEIVVGFESNLDELKSWRSPKLKLLIKKYIEWFEERGIKIKFDERSEVVSGVFSQGLLNYKKLLNDPGLAFFGESLGLNHPLNGYLINNISHHCNVMVNEIEKYLGNGKWNPHRSLIMQSPINYGPQFILSKRKEKSSKSGKGRSIATKKIHEMLVKFLGEDGLWSAIDNGIDFRIILLKSLREPQYYGLFLSLAFEYLNLVIKDEIYFEELRLKILKKMQS